MSQDDMGSLDKQTLLKINAGESGYSNKELIYQVQKIESHPNGKCTMVIHDGTYTMKALLQGHHKSLIDSKELIENTIIQINNHAVNPIKGQNIMIVQSMDVLQTDCPPLIDNGPLKPVPKQQVESSGGFGGSRNGFGNNNAFGKKTGFGGGGGARKSSGGGTGNFHPVKSLNPFMKDFKIKVRVTKKYSVRTWKNARTEGRLFTVNLLDAEGTEIQATSFNDAVDRLYPVFEEGKVFIIGKARVKVSNKRYTHIKHEYSLDLQDAEVSQVNEDTSIQSAVYDFKPIAQIEQMENQAYADVIGVCVEVSDVQNFTSKKGKELTKRTFSIMDNSNAKIECTLWGDDATNFPDNLKGKVLALQAARVSEFGGRTLACNGFKVEPQGVPEVDTVKQWYATSGGSGVKSLSTRGGGGPSGPPITLDEAKMLGKSEKPDYFDAKITVTQIPVKDDRTPWYNACPSTDDCKKKVQENGDGTWNCEKCNQSFTEYIPRWVLKCKVSDHSNGIWVSAFDEQATILLGTSAPDAEMIWKNKEQDQGSWDAVFKNPLMTTWSARIRAKQEIYQDEQRTRYDVLKLEHVDVIPDMTSMLDELRSMISTNH